MNNNDVNKMNTFKIKNHNNKNKNKRKINQKENYAFNSIVFNDYFLIY